MKRITELTLFTLTVLTLTALILHTMQSVRVSLDAMASDTAKSYLLTQPDKNYEFPVIEFTDEDLETDK